MSEQLVNPNKQSDLTEKEVNLDPAVIPDEEKPSETAPEPALSETPSESPKKKKTLYIIIGIIAVAAVVISILVFYKPKFTRVKNECFNIAGTVTSGKGYFTLDTIPDSWDNMDATVKALLLPNHQKKTLEAIKYANEALGFNGSVYNKMMETSALMGRQSEETSKYKVSWTYHPDDGLEVTYEKKK